MRNVRGKYDIISEKNFEVKTNITQKNKIYKINIKIVKIIFIIY